MRTFSFTKSRFLVEEINKVDEMRRDLLLTSLSQHDKLALRWEASLNHIYFANSLAGLNISKEQILELLSPIGKSRLNNTERLIVGYKKALDYITQDWLVNTDTVNEKIVSKLHQILTNTKTRTLNPDLENGLRYIQASPDHPLIQAGLAQILIQTEGFFGTESPQIASLTAMLFLYKHGYDFRRFLVIEEYFDRFKDRYHNLINQSMRSSNVTPWLEFMVEAAEYQLRRLLSKISSREFEENTPGRAILELNERQKEMLSLLDKPDTKISNMLVQKHFKISAITAARDLAKLTSLRLLFPVGKGRSTYYTKA